MPDPSLSAAYQYVIDACNDPNIGYSQDDRTTITLGVNYRTYCDCSSLLSKALTVAGYFKNNPWFATSGEREYLRRAGWVQQDINGQWNPGDILWRSGHTEMVYTGGTGKGVSMGAHTAKYSFERQVSISDKTTYARKWSSLWRDPTGTAQAYKWYMSNSYLDTYGDKMTGNAYMVYSYFRDLGFTNEAIAGMLGNMQRESTINPGVWQNLTPSSYDDRNKGYGLVQWTPPKGWFDYATANNIDINDADESGDGQCACVNNCTNDGQWLPNHPSSIAHNVRYTWQEFSQLTDAREALKAFCWEYLRPSSDPDTLRYDLREEYCDHWYDVITSGAWGGDPGDPSGRPDNVRTGILNDLQRRLVIPGRH